MAARWGEGNLAAGYQAAMGVMAALATLFFLFCFFTTTERVEHVVDKKPLREQVSLLLQNDQWLILCAVCFTGTLGYVIRNSVAAYYALYYLGADAKMLSAFLSTGVIAAILAMVASTWITKHYCKVKLFRWTQLLVGLLSVGMFLLVGPGDVALVFALFQLNPAPFCLLDEVDAPLDDANTERYCEMVRRMSDQTQFLFITHNKIAMEMAEQLIGVTMQEQGVSRIVAVDIDSAMRLTAEPA